MVIQEPVQAAIWHCLNHYDYNDAIFLAERLFAEVGSDEALYLLGTCYYRSGKPKQAYTILKNKGVPSPQCRYLLARCCLDINKLSEAESALVGNILHKPRSQDDMVNEFGDVACFAFSLLGKIFSKTERTARATESYRRSLKLNPYLWSSYESLCHLGEKPDPVKMFQVNSHNYIPPENVASSQNTPTFLQVSNTGSTTNTAVTPVMSDYCTPVPDNSSTLSEIQQHLFSSPYVSSQPGNTTEIITPSQENIMDMTPISNPAITVSIMNLSSSAPAQSAKKQFRALHSLSPLTPNFGVLPLDLSPAVCGQLSPLSHTSSSNLLKVPGQEIKTLSKKPMTRRSQQQVTTSHPKPAVFSQSGNTNSNTMKDVQSPVQQIGNNGLRRSTRLFSASSSSVKENNKSPTQKKFAVPKAPAKKTKSKLSRTQQELNEINKAEMGSVETKPPPGVTTCQIQVELLQKQSAEGLMTLLQDIGRGYLALAQYDCKKAIQLLSSLPPHHLNTGWVKCQIGRAYYEMADYQKAEKVFMELRQLEPHRLDGMELYSTVLWHLQREVQLSALAQELTELDRDAPEPWCVTGNCFSSQKEHDVAIKFFQRAVQVDANCAYAYTLLGHEYAATEELDKALACFRNAIRVDPRQYNAWYGLGMVYYKQEKLMLAEVHFRKALTINPQSSVLLCHIGVVQHALKKSDSALQTLNKAIAADPKNPLCKFHRASILFANEKHTEALQELEELKEIVPSESLVYFLTGKVHKKLGNTHLALMNFSWAMDLDPKGANNHIKEAIDKRYVTDDEETGTGDEPSVLEDPIEGSSNDSSLMEADDVQLQAMETDEEL
ncbi:hypothetical protein LSH36_819g00003 [Paralvinella palmiformis]|uniref:Cell division cycle protein 27 homolog n=1 Tax=Paralvinella palmiformis TaxID=53620 RepID=A0AAD9MUQ3_9ANNE|nr:hypothetical protein LSH36_819g00003 [Paralvinella palmiformis]